MRNLIPKPNRYQKKNMMVHPVQAFDAEVLKVTKLVETNFVDTCLLV